MLSHNGRYKLFSHLIQMFIQINEGLLYAFKVCNLQVIMEMKIFIFLLLQSLIVNARYRNDINTNVIAHGELSYLIAKIQGNINNVIYNFTSTYIFFNIIFLYRECQTSILQVLET